MRIINSSTKKKTIDLPGRKVIVVPAKGEVEIQVDLATTMAIQRAICKEIAAKELSITDINTSAWG